MKVLEALQKLIRVQGYANLGTVVQVCGRTKKDVLNILDENVALLVKKGAKIVGVYSKNNNVARNTAWSAGTVYKLEKINYGAAVSLEFINNPEADKLREIYFCGGMGDSYPVKVVLDTPENRKKLADLGMVCVDDITDWSTWTGYIEWKE